MDQSTSEIYRIANGTYVHVYRSSSTLKCSSLNLRTANCFFNFTDNREPIPAVSSVDRTTFDSGVRSWHLSSVGGCVPWESRRVHVGRGACCSMVLDRSVRLYHSIKEAVGFMGWRSYLLFSGIIKGTMKKNWNLLSCSEVSATFTIPRYDRPPSAAP